MLLVYDKPDRKMKQLQIDTGVVLSESEILDFDISVFSQAPNGVYLLLLTSEGYIHLIDPWTMCEIANIEGKASQTAFSHSNDYLAVGSATDYSVALYATPSFERVSTGVEHDDVIIAMSFSPNSKSLITASNGDGKIIIWQIPTLDKIKSYNITTGTLSSMLFVSDLTFLTGFSSSYTISCLFSRNTLTDELAPMAIHENCPVIAVISSSDKSKFVCALGNARIAVFDSATLTMVHSIYCLEIVQSLSFIDNNTICFKDGDDIVIRSLQTSGAVMKYPIQEKSLVGFVLIDGGAGKVHVWYYIIIADSIIDINLETERHDTANLSKLNSLPADEKAQATELQLYGNGILYFNRLNYSTSGLAFEVDHVMDFITLLPSYTSLMLLDLSCRLFLLLPSSYIILDNALGNIGTKSLASQFKF